jgi:hypothetical protein
VRLAGRFYQLPLPEAERIRRFSAFPDQQCSALDPCVGDGVALAEIASGERVLHQGVELTQDGHLRSRFLQVRRRAR